MLGATFLFLPSLPALKNDCILSMSYERGMPTLCLNQIYFERVLREIMPCMPSAFYQSSKNPLLFSIVALLKRYMCCLCRSIFFIHHNDLKILPPLYVLQSCITNAFLLSFQSTLLLCLTSVYNLRKSNDTRTFQPLPRLSTYLISVVLFVPFLSSEKQPCHLLLVN